MAGATESMNASHLSSNLKREREAKGLTQDQLGQRSGLQNTAISHFEKGRRLPSLPNLCRLCKALGVDANRLLS